MFLIRTQYKWLLAALATWLFASVAYCYYAQTEPGGPRGGSWQGMVFGILGALCMFAAGALSGRKFAPGSSAGAVKLWLRAHVYLGLLSGPLILYHCAFRWGGALEQWLMVVFAVVFVSGILGLALQQLLPGLFSQAVPAQAIVPQLDVACERLRKAAEEKIQELCGPVFLEPLPASEGAAPFSYQREWANFYWNEVAEFLHGAADRGHALANPTMASGRFAALKDILPDEKSRSLAEEVQGYCDERRQFFLQTQFSNWLHVWLLVHIPLSATLLVLGIIHVVFALCY